MKPQRTGRDILQKVSHVYCHMSSAAEDLLPPSRRLRVCHNTASVLSSVSVHSDVIRWAHLVVVVLSMEERLFLEDHTGQHTAQTPHVQTVVVHLHKVTCTKPITCADAKADMSVEEKHHVFRRCVCLATWVRSCVKFRLCLGVTW